MKKTQFDINLLKAELETQTVFADSLLRELAAIKNRSIDNKVLPADAKRALEIEEILKKKMKWVKAAQREIALFYKPAMAIPA